MTLLLTTVRAATVKDSVDCGDSCKESHMSSGRVAEDHIYQECPAHIHGKVESFGLIGHRHSGQEPGCQTPHTVGLLLHKSLFRNISHPNLSDSIYCICLYCHNKIIHKLTSGCT